MQLQPWCCGLHLTPLIHGGRQCIRDEQRADQRRRSNERARAMRTRCEHRNEGKRYSSRRNGECCRRHVDHLSIKSTAGQIVKNATAWHRKAVRVQASELSGCGHIRRLADFSCSSMTRHNRDGLTLLCELPGPRRAGSLVGLLHTWHEDCSTLSTQSKPASAQSESSHQSEQMPPITTSIPTTGIAAERA